MNPVRDFVAFDLETTGLERDTDRIIEIGAVRVREGAFEARMSRLARVDKPLTPLVESLTGIAYAQLAEADPLRAGLEEFLAFAGDLPLVAHNADFDAAFLSQALASEGFAPLANPVFDSLLLARTAWPRLDSHRLENLVAALGIPPQTAHRALPDAEQAAHVWLRAQEKLAGYAPAIRAALAHLLGPGPDHWRALFGGRAAGDAGASEDAGASADAGGVPGFDISGLLPRLAPGNTEATPGPGLAKPTASAESLFAGEAMGKAFAALSRPYQARSRQARVAAMAERAFQEGRVLALDADPGSGRALACLAAALRHGRARRRPVVYAAAARSRIERLAEREFPLLKALFPDARIEVLKPPSAYVSPRKLAGILAHPDTRLTGEERLALLPLLTWLEDAGDGDVAENSGFNFDRRKTLWSKLCSDSYAAEPEGHAYAAREKARRAHLVLITHELFLDDLALDFALLPPYEAIVFDDAHRLPEAGQLRLGREVGFFRLKHILQLIAQGKQDSRGLLAELERGAGILAPVPASTEESSTEESSTQVEPSEPADDLRLLRRLAFEPERQLQKFFNKIAKHAHKRRKDGESRLRYADKLVVEFNTGPEPVLTALRELEDVLRRLEGMRADLAPDLRRAADLLRDFRSDLDHLAHPSGKAETHWIEEFPNPHKALLRSAPLSFGPVLTEKFLPQVEAAVFVSPALAIGDDFSFFLGQTGLDSRPERLKTILVRGRGADEPLDPVFIARYSPVLSNPGALQAMTASLARGLKGLPRPTLALFTHIGMLKQARALLAEQLGPMGRLVVAQHVDGGRDNLLHLFRHRPDACLLATDAFVESLEPGDSLPSLVVVTKLPFPVPSEPLVAPHLERLQEEGKNPLHEYLLPCAILRLKQELNRLPRAPGSRLVIWILDPRLATEKYARFFQRGLGREARIFTREEDLFARTAEALGLAAVTTVPGETLAEPAAAKPVTAAEAIGAGPEAIATAPEIAATETLAGIGETQAEA
ncbi:MAG: 3'-5' exoribonuclease [Fibrobacteres bacterium]|nr:3'-5' exoribonuclease [Fibrobacterota bacterium]